jgi:AcrR family transcriptional regulator
MDTKERILQTALELYNSQGVNVITSRHIAARMGISAGNLHYHFKHTDEIIKTLYNRLATDFDSIISEMELLDTVDLGVIKNLTRRSFELVYAYRFIFLHFVEIGMRIPAIEKDYYSLSRRREKEFLTIFEKLKRAGIFRADIPAAILQTLVTQIFIVGDFWLSNNALTVKLRGNKAVAYYNNVFDNMFYPYLTAVALSQSELR